MFVFVCVSVCVSVCASVCVSVCFLFLFVFVFVFACLDVCVCVDDIYMRPVGPSFINYVTGGIIYICLMSRNYYTVHLFICLSII